MKTVEEMIIIKNRRLAKETYELILQGDLVSLVKEAGQFVNIQIDEVNLLRRPISICEVDEANQTLTLIYRVVGKGTEKLSLKEAGMTLNVFGPLGSGYPEEGVEPGGVALLVGGGVGVPPLYELAKRLHHRGVKVVTVMGFSNKDFIFYEEEFKQFGDVYLATDDGSYGREGNVLDVIKAQDISFDVFYSCGPKPMLRALTHAYPNTRGFVSLEERMACGIGACYACVCEKKDEEKQVRVCKEGPVFKNGEVVF